MYCYGLCVQLSANNSQSYLIVDASSVCREQHEDPQRVAFGGVPVFLQTSLGGIS